jgi:glutathione peroxidase
MRFWGFLLGGLAAASGLAMFLTASGPGVEAPAEAQTAKPAAAAAAPANAFGFTMTRIDGKPMPFSAFKGDVMLVVNTASFCGFTPQYEGLEALQKRFASRGFTVIGVPSGDFMSQEYDSNKQIAEFCEAKFGITFPMTERVHVTGPQAAPFFKWAKTQIPTNNVPQWNFHKFLVSRDGRVLAGFGSKVTPESPELVGAIEKALG